MPKPTCAECCEPIIDRHHTAVVCGQDCRRERLKKSDAYKRAKKKYRDGGGQTKVCEACGKHYRTTRSNGRVCSLGCRWFIDTTQPKSTTVPWYHCRRCNAWFVQRGTGSPVYCSDQCRAELEVRDHPPRECDQCGTEFRSGRPLQAYCGTACKHRAGNRRHRDRYGSDSYRARARRAGVHYQPFDRQDIFERDGWRCGICGYKVDQSLMYPNPMSVSLDHIVPLNPMDRGPHTPENTRCSHLVCNVERGRAGAPAQLRLC